MEVREIKKEPECLEVHSSPKHYKRLYQEYRNKATILAKKLWHKNVVISFLITYLLFSKGWIIVSTLFDGRNKFSNSHLSAVKGMGQHVEEMY